MWTLLLIGCTPDNTLSLDSATGPDQGGPGVAEATAALPAEPCPLEGGWLPAAPEADFLAQGATVTGLRARCTGALHATAGAGGSTVRVTLEAWDGAARARLTALDLLGRPVAGPVWVGAGEPLDLTFPRSGELLLRVDPEDPDEDDTAYTLSAACVEGCTLRYTRYPLVMMHGMGGTDSFLNLFEYFMEVQEDLSAQGYLVYTPAVDAFQPPELRAAQWAEHLQALVDAGVARRFNLFAHSQGGLDARYLVSRLGWSERVVSVTTLATPHHGTSIADMIVGVMDTSELTAWALEGAADALAAVVGLGDGAELEAQLAALTRPAVEQFNTEVPDVAGVRYFSWSARTCAVLDFACQGDSDGEIVDAHFIPTHTLIALEEGDNDGLVGLDTAVWGEHLGVVYADHLNQLGFFSNDLTSPFDHLPWFEAEAARIAALGF